MKYTNEERIKIHNLAYQTIIEFYKNDMSGRLLYLFVKKLSGISKLLAFKGEEKYRFVVISENEYKKLKDTIK